MANLTNDDVLKLAQLSRLQLTDEEIEQFKTEISTILDYVEQLQGVELDNYEPTYQVTGLKNVTRPDEVKSYDYTASDLLQNAPATEDGHIKVKRMLR
jgi:aspartyl-tRNA(Asn)/glutamyl-tRNA(Gln) amidotransferase subunit C